MAMSKRVSILSFLFLYPGSAVACSGGGGMGIVAFFVVLLISILLLPTFLIPVAGLLAIRPAATVNVAPALMGYAAFGLAAVMTGAHWEGQAGPAIALLLVAVTVVTTPSIYYFLVAYRAAKASAEEAA